MARLRYLCAACLAVVLLHVPPISDTALALRSAVVGLAKERIVHYLQPSTARPERPVQVPGGAASRDERPAGLDEPQWPSGAVAEVGERFDALARSFDVHIPGIR